MKRVAIINQKGGVGKTTTAANLSAALGRIGLRVLILDMDSQSNLTLHLSAPESLAAEGSTFEALVDHVDLCDIVREVADERVSIAPGSPDLAGIEQALANHIGRELLLRDALDKVADRFDIVLIDCPPSLGVLSLNALGASDYVLVPLQTEFFALQGMTQLMEVVQVVQQRLNPQLDILGILPCMVDVRTNLTAEVLDELENHFGDLLLKTRIRKNIKLAEAPSFGQSIFRYAPDSKGASDYLDLAKEVCTRLSIDYESRRKAMEAIEAANAAAAAAEAQAEAARKAATEAASESVARNGKNGAGGEVRRVVLPPTDRTLAAPKALQLLPAPKPAAELPAPHVSPLEVDEEPFGLTDEEAAMFLEQAREARSL